MLRHVVLMGWKTGTTAAQIEAVHAGLARLPGLIPEIRRYDVGNDLGLFEGNADAVLVADFDDRAGFAVYSEHPNHLEVIGTLIKPILESRTAAQYEVE